MSLPSCRWTAAFLPTAAKSLIASEVPIGRSSHSVSIVLNNTVLVFSGEELPRVPIAPNPNNNFKGSGFEAFDLKSKNWIASADAFKSGAPTPRVGHASAQIGDTIYILGGRGGAEMVPFPSNLYEFNSTTAEWKTIDPSTSDCKVESRSYHSMTASNDHVFVFGGCPAKGRLNDLHQFDPVTQKWTQFPTCPDVSPRGGAAVAVLKSRFVVFGGFNGSELGDMWSISISKDDPVDIPDRQWKRVQFPEGMALPDRRSVAGFVALKALDRIALFHGERDPSSKGHEGAGLYHRDVWTFKFGASFEEGVWEQHVVEKNGQEPTARGWIAASALDGDKVVMVGGFDGETRDNGVYVLSF
ncbi:hypothetical protein BDR26DRAFT_871199 [Obelidium mucronatum]|nr:hypothetical protein BDR26DRAFT_871199 [Obelidium mucronatum]